MGLVVALMLTTSAGGSIGGTGIEALFYARFGVQYLPHLYVALGFVSFLTSLAITALLARVARERLYVALPLVLAAALGAQRVAIASDQPLLYPLMWLLMNIEGSLQGLLSWGIAGAVCDTRQAKRLFPLFAAGGIFGAVGGGFATRPLVAAIHAENLLLVWIAGLLVAFVAARALVRGRGRRASRGPRTKLREDVQRGFQYVRGSSLWRWMSVAVVLFAVLYFSIAFPFSKAATATFPDTDALAGFLGLFGGLSTGAAFLASLFLANRVFAAFGLMNAVIAFTLIYVLGFAGLLVSTAFSALVAFRFAQTSYLSGIAGTAYQTLFNVIPAERRDQVRAFVDGVPGQAGIVIAGAILLVGEQALVPAQLYALGLVVAIAATLIVWRASRVYASALVATLRAGQPQIFFSEEKPFGGFAQDRAAVAAAVAALGDENAATRRIATEVLTHLKVPEAADALVARFGDVDAGVRAAALRALARAGVTRQETRGLLRDAEPSVRAEAALTLLGRGADGEARSTLLALARDPSAEIRRVGVQALARWDDPGAGAVIVENASDPDPDVRAFALAALPRAGAQAALPLLMSALADERRAVRASAATGLAAIGAPAAAELLGALGDEASEDAALEAFTGVPLDGAAEPLRAYATERAAAAQRYHELRRELSATGGEDRGALLVDALARLERRHATNALRALGLLGDRASFTLALEGLASREGGQRANAAETLESLGDAQVIRPLLRAWEPTEAPRGPRQAALRLALNDPDTWVRECATLVQQGGTTMETLATIPLLERILFLRRVPLFADLAPADLKRVAAIADEQLYADGAVVFRQGDPGDDLFVVVGGEMRVLREDGGARREIARRKRGEYVGEMALLSGEARNATLAAAGDTRLLRIERRQFEGILRERPETGLAVIAVLCARLSEATARLV